MAAIIINLYDEMLESEVAMMFAATCNEPRQDDVLGLARRVRDTQKENIDAIATECRKLREESAETATIKFLEDHLADWKRNCENLREELDSMNQVAIHMRLQRDNLAEKLAAAYAELHDLRIRAK